MGRRWPEPVVNALCVCLSGMAAGLILSSSVHPLLRICSLALLLVFAWSLCAYLLDE